MKATVVKTFLGLYVLAKIFIVVCVMVTPMVLAKKYDNNLLLLPYTFFILWIAYQIGTDELEQV